MSKEEKLKMAREFMNSMSDEEKAEMVQLILPMMVEGFRENDCRKMMTEMPSEMRQKCKQMMIMCLQACEEIERTSH